MSGAGGKITCYLDCVSPYSYFALAALDQKYGKALRSHNVEVDLVPVFLGGINVGSGNKPPWTLAAKGAYGKHELARAKKYFNKPDVKAPSFFPILSLLPQRALCVIKTTHPQSLLQSFFALFREMWENGVDVSKPEELARVLQGILPGPEVQQTMEKANSAEYKQALNDNTKQALDRGAFGCPWFWVKNVKGEEQPFFGSDRFYHIFDFLGLPWKDFELAGASTGQAKL